MSPDRSHQTAHVEQLKQEIKVSYFGDGNETFVADTKKAPTRQSLESVSKVVQ